MVASLTAFHTLSPSDDKCYFGTAAKGKDGRHVTAILNKFDFRQSTAWPILTHHFSSGVRHRELISIAQLISHHFVMPRISRDAKRSYPVLIKWFQDNWVEVEPIMPLIALRDETEEIINHRRERASQASA
jgi:hypothetical protein